MHPAALHHLLSSATALLLVAAGLLATASPAAAANALPWRFTTVSESFALTAGSSTGRVLTCPAGFRPVWGGVAPTASSPSNHGIRRYLEYTDPPTGTYHIGLRNSYGAGGPTASIKIVVHCVWAASLGSITYVSQTFARNAATGHAGGTVTCPGGYRVMTGGADWANADATRSIDYSSPLLDGSNNATSWYAAGQSPTSGDTLFVEAYCIESGYLGSQVISTGLSATAGFSGQDLSAGASCPVDYRILTAGAVPAGTTFPFQDRGWAWASGPADPRTWSAAATLVSGDQLEVVAVCIPASKPTVSISPQPASPSSSNSAAVGYLGSDPTGESTVASCHLDGQSSFSCASGSTYPFDNLSDGSHTFSATVTNESGASTTASYSWDVDTVAPTIADLTPASSPSVTGPLTISFSEDVTGVDATSITVHGQASNADVAGTVSSPNAHTATWRPTGTLLAGETYRVSFSGAIHDIAGNALSATFADRRTSTIVDNTSVALQRLWDRDASTKASGGAFIVERLAGSRAELTFTASAGQTVSVYGLRMSDGGYADVYLDGVKKARASFYAASTGRARAYLSGGLTGGRHTISIRPTGTRPTASSGAWVRVDNVVVGAAITQETALKQSFRTVASASAFDGSYAQIGGKSGDTTPAQFRLTAVGSGLRIYATKSTSSGSARVYVDGVLKATINLHAASTVNKALVYSTTFALGVHAIRIEAVGTSSGASSSVNLDRITLN